MHDFYSEILKVLRRLLQFHLQGLVKLKKKMHDFHKTNYLLLFMIL